MNEDDIVRAEVDHILKSGQIFQPLCEFDIAEYETPELCFLVAPRPSDELSERKRQKWLTFRAASYPAKRHSEYLFIPKSDREGNGPKIMLSAVMRLPMNLPSYLERMHGGRRYTVRGRKAESRGYRASEICPGEHAQAIWEVVHSSSQRQGRPISPLYADRPRDWPFSEYCEYQDPNYADICCGVFTEHGKLAAYLLGKRVGDHVQYDEIMRHADHVGSDVMYLLHYFFLKTCLERASIPKCLNYGPWYSGVNPFAPNGGLNEWKRRVGFRPAYLILASF